MRPFLALFAMLTVAGCCGGGGIRPNQQRLAEWHFESDCTSDLCGFTTVQGAAIRVNALTSGEHALQLAPGTVLQQNFSVPVPNGSSLSASIAARCDAGTTLAVQVLMTDTVSTFNPDGGFLDGGFMNGQRVMVTETSTLDATTNWTLLQGDLLPVGREPQNVTSQVATQIQISISGAGSCTIDDVVLTASNVNGFIC